MLGLVYKYEHNSLNNYPISGKRHLRTDIAGRKAVDDAWTGQCFHAIFEPFHLRLALTLSSESGLSNERFLQRDQFVA